MKTEHSELMADTPLPTDSLEVKLAFQTIACRTCKFFWPTNGSAQPYGPYSTFDLDQNFPTESNPPAGNPATFSWAQGITSAPGFPSPEIMDGCRKAPIMTIGINPNLTSFFPGPTGASWCYPAFTSANGGDANTKYAYYYRYRSIYQEHFDFNPQFIEPYLLPEGRIVATADGKIGLIKVTGNAPPVELDLEYTGENQPFKISLNWVLGEPPYVVLFSSGTAFKQGDLLAAKLSVTAGKPVNVDRQIVTYYDQFVPVINYLSQFLQNKGNAGANVRMGEDVCQLDMVACASPHWAPPYMGGTITENGVINNCISANAWVIKQLVQTRPAVLYIIGEVSFDMFRDNLGNLVKSNVTLPSDPADGAFTLLRQTIDPLNPVTLEYSYNNAGVTYNLSTRLVISPHFSFYYLFIPQFRFSPADLETLKTSYAACYNYITHNPDMSLGQDTGGTYTAFQINSNVPQTLNALQANYGPAYSFLQANYYDVHAMLSTVLEDLYTNGEMSWVAGANGDPGYLARNTGSCDFCVNNHWEFPLGCPYKKNTEAPPAPGFLEMIAADMVAKGKPAGAIALKPYAEKLVIAPDGKIVI